MIQHIAISPKNQAVVIQTSGWGKFYTRPAKINSTDAELIAWQKWAEAHIVLDKLKGFVKARAEAYEAKHYVDAVAKGYVKLLLFFISSVQHQKPSNIYAMVVAHEHKFRTLLPNKANAFNKEIPEIIAFCKLKAKS